MQGSFYPEDSCLMHAFPSLVNPSASWPSYIMWMPQKFRAQSFAASTREKLWQRAKLRIMWHVSKSATASICQKYRLHVLWRHAQPNKLSDRWQEVATRPHLSHFLAVFTPGLEALVMVMLVYFLLLALVVPGVATPLVTIIVSRHGIRNLASFAYWQTTKSSRSHLNIGAPLISSASRSAQSFTHARWCHIFYSDI